MYNLKCADMGHTECSFVAKGETQEQTIADITKHAVEAHPDDIAKINLMTPEQKEAVFAMMNSKMTQET